MPISYSPLRYPGGKGRLANFLKLVLKMNNLEGGTYVEPFAGGAGAAISLLSEGYVKKIIINDIDPTIYSFWYSILNHTEEFVSLIESTPVDMNQWNIQKDIFESYYMRETLELGFATFFLNRTNRSGILKGGVIGGKRQTGAWKIDARYNIDALIGKIENIASLKDKITLYSLDARELIEKKLRRLPKKSLVYLDPPYFHKGQHLYHNSLRPDDHILIAHCIKKELKGHWMVSYDNAAEIRALYEDYRCEVFELSHTAAESKFGSELITYSHDLVIPTFDNPFKITSAVFDETYELA